MTALALATVYFVGDGMSGATLANGAPFTRDACHIAHRTLPLGSRVRVCSVTTGRCTTAMVRDRGPYGHRWRGKRVAGRRVGNETIDLTKCVWRRIGGRAVQWVSVREI